MTTWDPQRQLQEMTWFEKLRGVAWSRSVWLAEWSQLASQDWWWAIQKATKKEFKDLCPFELTRGRGDQTMAYGETPAITILELLRDLEAQPPLRFVDLGSGRGSPSLVTASLGYPSKGIEIQSEFVERANRIAQNLKLPAEFEVGDFLNQPWPEADLYFCDATAFDDSQRQKLLEQLLKLDSALVILGHFEPQHTRLRLLKRRRLPVYWGVGEFALFELIPTDSVGGTTDSPG